MMLRISCHAVATPGSEFEFDFISHNDKQYIYGGLQLNKLGRKIKETLSGFYR